MTMKKVNAQIIVSVINDDILDNFLNNANAISFSLEDSLLNVDKMDLK